MTAIAASEPLAQGNGAHEARRVVPILANPYSGSGPNRRHVERFVAALASRGLEPRVVWRPDERRAILADPQTAEVSRCVVAAGGDGSIADAINDMDAHGLLGRLPFATLPIGTENLFARELGFTLRGDRLANAIERGRTRDIDLGATTAADGTRRLFTLMASAGFDAEVVHRMARWRCDCPPGELRRVTRLSYAPRLLGCIRQYRYPAITLEADGQTHTGSHVFVFNLPQYGGNLGIARHARADDAQLDWVVFQRPGLVSLARYGASVLLSRHLRCGDVLHGRSARVRLSAEAPVALQADGDPAGFAPIEVEARPGALRIVHA